MNDHDPPPRSSSVLILTSASPRFASGLKKLNQTHEYQSIINPFLDVLKKKDQKARDLDLQLQDQVLVSAGLDNEVNGLKLELDTVRECAKEQRAEFSRLKGNYIKSEKELQERIDDLVAEKLELVHNYQELEGEMEQVKKTSEDRRAAVTELKETISGLLKRRDNLLKELAEWKDIKEQWKNHDLEFKTLTQEINALKTEKAAAVEVEGSLLQTIQRVQGERLEWEEKSKQDKLIMAGMQGEIDSLDSYIRRIKIEREEFRDKAESMETERDILEKEQKSLKRTLRDFIKKELDSDSEDDAPNAKRSKTPTSGKVDGSPVRMRSAHGSTSSDTTRILPLSPPDEDRRVIREIESFD